jgi:hypothetical protein
MGWARILAYVAGVMDQELLARNEYPAARMDVSVGKTSSCKLTCDSH